MMKKKQKERKKKKIMMKKKQKERKEKKTSSPILLANRLVHLSFKRFTLLCSQHPLLSSGIICLQLQNLRP